ncbi:cytochrome P450 [Dendrothele bispora CBS 962.96]|uniref:Cytochrome P450 n=1 Tax=Dendrothele bispora (strain CBS 962.96) TaxID=1314807 RepID=A0A4S8KZZ9_DENBC|nr:cytochrome P450 [Dendrothele bispora CBS 962.96]
MPVNLFSQLGLSLVAISSILWLYTRRRSQHHGRSPANIPGPKCQSWWKGNFKQAFNSEAWDFHERLLKEYGPVLRIDGLMGDQQIITFDPKAMYHILVKDQSIWARTNVVSSALVFGKGLTSIDGEAHRKQRKALNPVFSAAHMRDMVSIFYDVINKLEKGLTSKVQDEAAAGSQEIEILSWLARTALELIGQAGLGYSFDNLTDEYAVHPYIGLIKELQVVTGEMRFFRTYIVPIVLKIGTPSLRRWVLEKAPWKNGHRIMNMSDYMWNLSKEIYAGKKKSLDEGDEAVAKQVGKGKDIMSILMRMNLQADGADKLDDDEVLGQMSVFIFAAMDTTSGALARILHLLSARPEVQEKLRQELLEARQVNKDIPYDVLVSLPYLDAICRETLRLFPPVTHIFRTATQDTTLPFSNPVMGIDGTSIPELHVPGSTGALISVLNSNRNPAIWGPDAHEWKPERWLAPLPETLTDAHIAGVYSHLMTFSAGGRSCIGFKFSQLEMKAVLSMLIAKFRFSPSSKEVIWQMNAITTPSLKHGGKYPQLPLVVTKVDA